MQNFSDLFEVNCCSSAFRIKEMIDYFLELWATQQTERIDRRQEKDKYVRTTIRELIVYLVFLTILSIGKMSFLIQFLFFILNNFLVVFGMISSNMFVLTQALQSGIIDPQLTDESNNKTGPAFEDFDRMEDFWQVRGKYRSFPNIFLRNSLWKR